MPVRRNGHNEALRISPGSGAALLDHRFIFLLMPLCVKFCSERVSSLLIFQSSLNVCRRRVIFAPEWLRETQNYFVEETGTYGVDA
jgi:hypothetical protein